MKGSFKLLFASYKLFFFGHRSLIRNNTTAVTNMTKNRMLENKIIELDVSYVSTYTTVLNLDLVVTRIINGHF